MASSLNCSLGRTVANIVLMMYLIPLWTCILQLTDLR